MFNAWQSQSAVWIRDLVARRKHKVRALVKNMTVSVLKKELRTENVNVIIVSKIIMIITLNWAHAQKRHMPASFLMPVVFDYQLNRFLFNSTHFVFVSSPSPLTLPPLVFTSVRSLTPPSLPWSAVNIYLLTPRLTLWTVSLILSDLLQTDVA